MNARLDIPSGDAWFVARLGEILGNRLLRGNDDFETRRVFLRLMFGLQRLPAVNPDLVVTVHAGLVAIELSEEVFGLESFTDDGHTEFRLQYFSGSNHCIHGYDFLTGEKRRGEAEIRIREFEQALEAGERLIVQDFSKSGSVDEFPLLKFTKHQAKRT